MEVIKRIIISAVVLLVFVLHADALNIRRVSNADGMSNSAALSLCQDYTGMLWIGTCDGINLYDGRHVYPFVNIYPESQLSGNIIEGITETKPGEMWIQTNYGLNRLDTNTGHVTTFSQFHGHEILRKNSSDRPFVIDEDGRLYCFDPDSDEFRLIAGVRTDRDNVLEVAFVADRILLFCRDGIKSVNIRHSGNTFTAGETDVISDQPIEFASSDGRITYYVTEDGLLMQFNIATFNSTPLTSIAQLIAQRGGLSSIVADHSGNLYISFSTNGAVRAMRDNNYRPIDLGIDVGVFKLVSSDEQDVVWIGSDCGGVYTCSAGQFDVKTITYGDLEQMISNPVRCIFLDPQNNLWLGTKGDGLLQLSDFDTRYLTYKSPRLWSSDNSGLRHNSVFALADSRRQRMWIATEEGLNIYDYNTGRISQVESDVNMRWLHGVLEMNDSVLWTASLGRGVYRSLIDNSGAVPRLYNTKQLLVGDRTFSDNYFFSISTDSNGRPVFANRGKGIYLYDERLQTLKPVTLRNTYDSPAINDAFTTIKDDSVLWIGTGNGLIKQTPTSEKLFKGKLNGFTNNTIHSLLKHPTGDIWASTNKGIVILDPITERTRIIDSRIGVDVTEFSDGAALLTPDSLLIFGGIDGIAIVRHIPDAADRNIVSNDHQPRLISLSVNGKDVPLYSMYSSSSNTITINHDQNHIDLAFSDPEFVTPGSTSLLYSLDGSVWLNNGNSYRLPLNSLVPGKHTLYVKSYNHDTQSDSNLTHIDIMVTPPWYQTDAAIAIYVFIVLALIAIVGLYVFRRQRRSQREAIAKMRQAHKEELYEEKLRFFTNITHEFCTPLTLISGPCERILSYEHSDDYIRKYATLIFSNGKRLNNLIQEIIDLRRIETGHSPRKVRHIDVSELCNDTIATFDDMAERTSITVVDEVTPGIVWNTDYNSISKIVNNLISNAFKYTPTGGTIRVALSTDGNPETLRLVVWNTGKGIRPEDKERIFNRYAILDNIEEKVTHGLSARNGLGMAICYTMIKQLEGNIEIESEVGSFASFIVTLPQLKVDTAPSETDNVIINRQATPNLAEPVAPVQTSSTVDHNEVEKYKGNAPRRLLIVDDNEEMLTLLADSLSEYDVTTASDGSVAIDMLTKSVFDLVITDVMMPGTDGLELARQIKANRHTAHIPLIILSAKVSNDEIIQGIESGADVYIRKPFSFGYLRAMISRLIQRQDQLRDYYNTSGSAFMYDGGQLVSREDKEFVDSLTTYIESNIEDSELTIDSVSRHLNMSTRNLYRKLKDLGMASPNDLIKEHRMTSAARLLCTTSLTVKEIMFRTGFANRSHFFREFAKRYNMTPKEYRMANYTRDDTLTRRGETTDESPIKTTEP